MSCALLRVFTAAGIRGNLTLAARSVVFPCSAVQAALGFIYTRYGFFWWNFLFSTGSALSSTATLIFVFKPMKPNYKVWVLMKKNASVALHSAGRSARVKTSAQPVAPVHTRDATGIANSVLGSAVSKQS